MTRTGIKEPMFANSQLSREIGIAWQENQKFKVRAIRTAQQGRVLATTPKDLSLTLYLSANRIKGKTQIRHSLSL